MAYMTQEKKKQIAEELKTAGFNSFNGWKITLGVDNHSTIVCTVRQAPYNMFASIDGDVREQEYHRSMKATDGGRYWNVNHYHIGSHDEGKMKNDLDKINEILNDGNWDESDVQTDYFNVGWYVNLSIGKWDKGFTVHPKFTKEVA